jgi:hypothetical protein
VTSRRVPRKAMPLFRAHVGIGALAMLASAFAVPAAGQEAGFPKLLRYDEDYSDLADPDRRTGPFDPVKYIPLDDDNDVYLTLSGEARGRFEATTNPAFGLQGTRSDSVFLHRLLLGADLHLGSSVRVFAQLGSYDQSGRKGGSLPTDEDHLDLQQGFIDVSPWSKAGARATVRLGRQEMSFGSSRFVSVREGPNGRRSFDGVRGMYRSPRLDIDLFATRPVQIRPRVFDDRSDDGQQFWGGYAVRRLGGGQGIDLYYLGLDRDHAVYASGVGPERRHTLGLRLWGKVEAFDYNGEAAYQFGRFVGADIRAFAVSLDAGYGIDAALKPRIGIKLNVESGDRDPSDRQLGTFNPLFPNHAYFSEAGFGAPMNGLDVQPNVTLQLAPRLSLMTGVNFFWRHRTADAVYNSALLPLPGTAAAAGRYIGAMSTTHLRWRLTPNWEFNLDYSRFGVGDAIRNAGGRRSSFFMGSAAFRF